MNESQRSIRYRIRNRSPLLKENFFPWGLLALLFILLPLLYALLWYAKNEIQNTIQSEVKQQLVAQNLDWVNVDVDGQAVTLSGSGPKSEGDRAISIAKQIKEDAWLGRFSMPSKVKGNFTQPAITKKIEAAPKLVWGRVNGVLESGVLTLTGVVGSQAEKQALIELANRNISEPRLVSVIDKLKVSKQKLHPESAQLAERVSKTLSVCNSGQGSSVDGVFSLNCQTTRQQAQSIDSSARLPIDGAKIGAITISSANECNQSFAKVLEGKSIGFSTNSATLKSSSSALLDQIAELAKSCPGSIRVEGHTDKTGSLERNMTLSNARAEAVVEALVERNVQRERLTAQGFGPTQPRAEGDTREAHALNRRIEFHISE